jgi:hypothetical protein
MNDIFNYMIAISRIIESKFKTSTTRSNSADYSGNLVVKLVDQNT